MARSKDDGLPIAVATQAGFLATLIVLLVGTLNGTRAWILLIKGAMAFLLTSALLKLIAAAVMQFIRLKASAAPDGRTETEEMKDTARLISSAAQTPEAVERVNS